MGTRRAWLMLGWGIVLLTVIDGVMLSFDPQYEPSNANNKNNENDKKPNGPVLSIFTNILGVAEDFVEIHEKVLIVLSTFAIAAFTWTLYRATSGLLRISSGQLEVAKRALIDLERPYIIVDLRET
jgi:hypothetical protein